MIDLHCHILPGVDDGPATVEDSLALARAAAEAGTQVLVATPHVSWEYPNDTVTIARLVRELNARFVMEDVALQVHPGAEIATTRIAEIPVRELASLTLGGGGCLLIEPPFAPTASGIDGMIQGLQRQGYRVIIAHPERCLAFHRDRGLLEVLANRGVLCSVTAGSLVGRFGHEVRRFAHQLVADGLVHNVASDAHDTVRRPPGIASELEQAGLQPLAEWLTYAVPEAILTGATIPPRPLATHGPRRGWRTRRLKLGR